MEGNHSDGIMSRKGTYIRNFEEDNVQEQCMKISLGWSEQILLLISTVLGRSWNSCRELWTLIMVLRDLPSYLFPKMSLKKGFLKSEMPFFTSNSQVQDFLACILSLIMSYTYSLLSCCLWSRISQGSI